MHRAGEVGLVERGADMPHALSQLSGRERELLGLMAAGRSNSAISQELWLSPKTVESHVRSIFAKLGLQQAGRHRRVTAVLMYLESTDRHDVAAWAQASGVRPGGGSLS